MRDKNNSLEEEFKPLSKVESSPVILRGGGGGLQQRQDMQPLEVESNISPPPYAF
jgi:hypothetical protein